MRAAFAETSLMLEYNPGMSDISSRQLVREFGSTRWSLVLEASQNRCGALSELCEAYWPSIYSFARRKGHSPPDAEDLTQGFFAYLLGENSIGKADPNRGRFRSFLLTSFRNFMVNEWGRRQAQKRGGQSTIFSIDFERGEEAYRRNNALLTPDEIFDRQWAAALLDRVLERLRAEYEAAGRLENYNVLKVFLAGKSTEMSFREGADRLGTSESAAMSAASRMRRRYRELLVAEIAETVASPDEIDDEVRALFRSLG